MFNIISQAKNAIDVYNAALQANSNNIAALSVPGYKRTDVTFQSIFEKILSSGTPASTLANLGGTNPIQYGQGVGIGSARVDFSQGQFASSSPIDVGIDGSGLFIVSADGGASYLYTRAGQFNVVNGNLVTASGLQVYGLDSSGALVPISGLAGSSSDYSWNDGTGELLYQSTSTGYRMALSTFTNPSGLAQAQGTTFAETLASGPASSPQATGGSAGNIKSSNLEQSNVVYLTETITSLELQRAISANLTIVTAASELISSFINKLG